ncbi:MAG TPA: 2OG-Fe(II) oxygenase [Gammaproteobacteria bacterium]|nr:2OG-Fe(II) oxygenase [Gammaproteobacteria bacterium]
MSGNVSEIVNRGLFKQAVELFTSGRFADAASALARATDAGDAEAQNLLGVMHLNGMGVTQEPRRSAALFSAAAEQGLKEARYNLSNLLYNGLGVRRDETRAQEELLAAARAGHRPALRSLGYLYHLRGDEERWQRLSTRCFHIAAEAGDPLAKYAYGMRLAQGHGTGVDTPAALQWLSAAAQDRVYLAPARVAELRARAPAAAARSAAAERGVELETFDLPRQTAPRPSRSAAFMSEYEDALDPYLCDHLINTAMPSLGPSGVVDPKTGGGLRSEMRTSYSMSFLASMYDAVVAESLRRIAAIAGLPAEHAEPVGVLRYGPGQEYRPHFDFYDDAQHEAQRVSTVFVYLNDVAEGGGTEFPRLGVTVDPKRAKAVKFLNCDAAGKPNPETLHAGLPVIRGEKWLATLWFWDRPFLWFG